MYIVVICAYVCMYVCIVEKLKEASLLRLHLGNLVPFKRLDFFCLVTTKQPSDTALSRALLIGVTMFTVEHCRPRKKSGNPTSVPLLSATSPLCSSAFLAELLKPALPSPISFLYLQLFLFI